MDLRENYLFSDNIVDQIPPIDIPLFNLFNFSIENVYSPSFDLIDLENEYAMELS